MSAFGSIIGMDLIQEESYQINQINIENEMIAIEAVTNFTNEMEPTTEGFISTLKHAWNWILDKITAIIRWIGDQVIKISNWLRTKLSVKESYDVTTEALLKKVITLNNVVDLEDNRLMGYLIHRKSNAENVRGVISYMNQFTHWSSEKIDAALDKYEKDLGLTDDEEYNQKTKFRLSLSLDKDYLSHIKMTDIVVTPATIDRSLYYINNVKKINDDCMKTVNTMRNTKVDESIEKSDNISSRQKSRIQKIWKTMMEANTYMLNKICNLIAKTISRFENVLFAKEEDTETFKNKTYLKTDYGIPPVNHPE